MRRVAAGCIRATSRAAIAVTSCLVPAVDRAKWRREWLAELESSWGRRAAAVRPAPSLHVELRCLKRALLAARDAADLRRHQRPRPRSVSAVQYLARSLSTGRTELVHAARRLRRCPSASASVVVVLGLGIAANAAMAGISRSLLFEPLPAADPEELVRLYNRLSSGFAWAPMSWLDVNEYHRAQESVVGVAAEAYVPLAIEQDGAATRTWGAVVTGNYFELLGIRPRIGRLLTPDDDRLPGGHPVVVISSGFWQRRFGGSPTAVGSELRINGTWFAIVGVAPADFAGINRGADPVAWLPAMMFETAIPGADWLRDRTVGDLWPIARLRPGVELPRAAEDLVSILEGLREADPVGFEQTLGLSVIPEAEGGIHPFYRAYFVQLNYLFAAVVGIVLFLSCINASGLMVAMATGRGQEAAIRRALGASRVQVWRCTLAEAALLGSAALLTGILAANWLLVALSRLEPPTDVPISLRLELGGQGLLIALAASAAGLLLSGAIPAAAAARIEPAELLRRGDRSATAASRWQRLIVITQVALCTVLLVGTSLFVRALSSASEIDAGFDPEGVVVSSIDLDLAGYREPQGRVLQDQLLRRLVRIPFVERAALSDWLPFPVDPRGTEIVPRGWSSPDGAPEFAAYATVSPGFLEVLEVPMVAGRPFEEADDSARQPVAIVNETFASRYWPQEEAIGKRVRMLGAEHRVVGVAANAKYRSLAEDPVAFVYLPSRQRYTGITHLLVRSAAPSSQVLREVREAIASIDPALPVHGAQALSETFGLALLPARLGSSFLGLFATLASVLAATGLYGALAYHVACRRREFGTRIALGATGRDVATLIFGASFRMVACGVFLGVPFAIASGRLMADMLYGVGAIDPLALGGSVAIIATVAVFASAVPAMRASQVNARSSLTD